MNTTLNMLSRPEVKLDEKTALFSTFKRAYYNDEITYEQLETYIELLYGTRHRIDDQGLSRARSWARPKTAHLLKSKRFYALANFPDFK